MGDLLSILTRNFDSFSSGFLTTCRLVVVSFTIAMVVGTVIGGLRAAPSKALNRIGAIYVEFFRNIPLLVLIYIAYDGLARAGLRLSAFVAGTLCLGLYTAAYVAESIRSGVFAIGKGQFDAALSLGFTQGETLRKIVLPQAIRTVIPPLGGLTIAMIKNSAILGGSLLAINDLLLNGRLVANNNARYVQTFFWAAVGYLILTGAATIAVRVLEKRLLIKR
ncbi:MAG: amino acid ABC transporter permease [Actinobacteria bacterium]|nr:amino acid ABC transporter permease [Actinomycetota bacterium]